MRFRQLIKRTPWWGKLLIILLLLFAIGAIGVSIYLTRMVNGRLRELVLESSNGLYKLDYSKVSVNALTGNLSVYDARLTPDTTVFAQLQQHHLKLTLHPNKI